MLFFKPYLFCTYRKRSITQGNSNRLDKGTGQQKGSNLMLQGI